MHKKLGLTLFASLIAVSLLVTPVFGQMPIKKDTTIEEYTVETVGESYNIVTVVKGPFAWFERMKEGVQQFAEVTGHKASQLAPSSADAPKQVKILEDLIAKGNVDAICVVPISVPALEPVLQKAQEAGIVTIGHEGANLKHVDYDIEAFTPADYGRHFMNELAGFMDEEGKYATFVGHLTAKSHNQWVDAEIATQKEKYPNMELVSKKQESEESKRVSYQKAKKLFQTYPELEGFIGSAATTVAGIGQAVEEYGIVDSTYVIGTSLVSVSEEYLKSGAVDMISFWDPAFAGYAMNKIAVRVLEGKAVPEGFDLGIAGYHELKKKGNVLYGNAWVDVTKKNMDKYDF